MTLIVRVRTQIKRVRLFICFTLVTVDEFEILPLSFDTINIFFESSKLHNSGIIYHQTMCKWSIALRYRKTEQFPRTLA